MKLVSNEKVIEIIQRTLDHVDGRLVDHGRRVAYMVFKMFERRGGYDDRRMRDICLLAMLHDIGAYKTEEIDRMVIFETADVWDHSIYGYLFLKYFSPLRKLAPVIFFHHADCRELECLPPEYRELAMMISLCDRADIFAAAPCGTDEFRAYINKRRDSEFSSGAIDLFLDAGIDLREVENGVGSDENFRRVLYETPLSEKEADAYIRMLISSVEFRSLHTVIHTVAAVSVGVTLARLLGLGGEMVEKMRTAATLHDIGKTGIPVNILESPGRLSDDEMTIMKTHVVMSEEIITGCVDEETLRIAVRHHEKLDGGGYMRGLSAEELTVPERLFAIADIFSALCGTRSYKEAFSKEKTLGILNDMAEKGHIDADIVSVIEENFDRIMIELDLATKPVIELFHEISDEYAILRDKVKSMDDACVFLDYWPNR